MRVSRTPLYHGANSSDAVALTADCPCTSPVAVLATKVLFSGGFEKQQPQTMFWHTVGCSVMHPYLPPHERCYFTSLLPPISPVL